MTKNETQKLMETAKNITTTNPNTKTWSQHYAKLAMKYHQQNHEIICEWYLNEMKEALITENKLITETKEHLTQTQTI